MKAIWRLVYTENPQTLTPQSTTNPIIHYEQKIAAFRYYINRMITLPITERSKIEDWNTIISIATSNGYPKRIIYNLRQKMKNRIQQKDTQEHQTEHKKWTAFTYFSPLIRQITNLFKDTNINIAFRTTNTIQQQLSREINNSTNPSGIYKLQCNTCKMAYIGQSGRSIATRYKEHIRYIRNNSPQSAYAMHIS